MMKYISLLLLCSIAFADTPPPGTVKAKTFTGDGVTGITATGTALNVNVTNASGLTTVNQGTGGASAWLVNVANASFPVTGVFWQSVQPISASALPLPAGAATSALQTSGNSSLTSIDSKTPALGQALAAGSVPVVLTSAQLAAITPLTSISASLLTGSNTIGAVNINGTVPISGTITATNAANGTTGSAAPTTATLVGGSDGTNLRAIKVSATGVQSVDGSAVTQPVSGTVTANAGTGTFAVSAAALPLPTGAATSAKQPAIGTAGTPSVDVLTVQGATSMTALKVDGSAVTQPVSGTVTANAGTGTFAVSASALPLPAGAATSALQTTGNTSVASIDTKTPALGQALSAASVPVVLPAAQITTLTPPTTVTVTQGTGTNLHTVVDSGAVTATISGTPNVAVTSSALPTGAATSANQSTEISSLATIATNTTNAGTPTVSGTVTANAGTGTFAVSAASLPLPTGAATSALQTTGNTSLNSIDTKTPALGQTTMSASVPVTISSDQSTVGTTMPDLFFTGQAAQTATVNNIIPAAVSANATDAAGFRSASVQIVSTGTGGTFIFEGSNDNTNFQTIPVYSQLILTGTPITAAITPTATQLIYTFPVTVRYIRVRIATTITGGSIQAFTRFSQSGWTPAVFQVANATAANLATTATIASGTVTTVSTVSSVTSDQLAIPGIIADVASGAIITTTTTATLTPTFGAGYKVTIPVTVVSGTLPTMSVAVQESGDTGTNWNTVYTFPTIIATGYYESPPLFFKGNRVRYVQTITGTTPSFTRAINRLQMSAIDSTPVNNNASMTTTTVPTTCSTLTAPANAVAFVLENLSSNTVNMFWSLGATLATSTTGMLLEPGRDTGEVHAGSNVTLCAASGTPTYAIQWVQQ